MTARNISVACCGSGFNSKQLFVLCCTWDCFHSEDVVLQDVLKAYQNLPFITTDVGHYNVLCVCVFTLLTVVLLVIMVVMMTVVNCV